MMDMEEAYFEENKPVSCEGHEGSVHLHQWRCYKAGYKDGYRAAKNKIVETGDESEEDW